MKFEILALLAPVQSNWHNFSWAELETKSQFSPKLFMTLQYHNMKLLPQILAEPMYLLDKTIP